MYTNRDGSKYMDRGLALKRVGRILKDNGYTHQKFYADTRETASKSSIKGTTAKWYNITARRGSIGIRKLTDVINTSLAGNYKTENLFVRPRASKFDGRVSLVMKRA